MLLPKKSSGGQIKTLIHEFEYPRLGPGMMWEAFHHHLLRHGGHLKFGAGVTRLEHADGRIVSVEYEHEGIRERVPVSSVIATMPLRELIHSLAPAPPAEIVAAANRLHYRDFLTVALIIDAPTLFPDNWIYVHDPRVKLGRIQNFKNWSPAMVPDSSKTCLGLEYFCFEGDGLWTMPDPELIRLGTHEVTEIGLLHGARVIDGTVVRMPKAYPVYDEGFQAALDTITRYLSGFSNLHVAGRNGLHKYNNQDHSMLTAMLAVRNLLGETHDVWNVNTERSYHEEIRVPHDALSSDEAGVAE
jgi:protoporphyrinogen oxidase